MMARNDYVHPYWESSWFFSRRPLAMWMDVLGMVAGGHQPGPAGQAAPLHRVGDADALRPAHPRLAGAPRRGAGPGGEPSGGPGQHLRPGDDAALLPHHPPGGHRHALRIDAHRGDGLRADRPLRHRDPPPHGMVDGLTSAAACRCWPRGSWASSCRRRSSSATRCSASFPGTGPGSRRTGSTCSTAGSGREVAEGRSADAGALRRDVPDAPRSPASACSSPSPGPGTR